MKHSELRKNILQEMHVLPIIDPQTEIWERIDLLKNYLRHSGMKGYVLGISGGQDSALVGKLCQIAVQELRDEKSQTNPAALDDDNYKFIALLLPHGTQRDIQDARNIAENFIKADFCIEYNIGGMVNAMESTFNSVTPIPLTDFNKGNVKARARTAVQYAYASQFNLLVAGCDHSAENITGFFTLGGDGLADVMPIFGLNKRQGKQLLQKLGASPEIYTKEPTADLLEDSPGQTDEEALGVTYDELDDYLEGRNVSVEVAQIIEDRYYRTEFKRRMPVNLYM